jgi:2,5-diamino-6-hydroxy-4-(5-phosphoribosylamino)pyrimidine 1'-reductase
MDTPRPFVLLNAAMTADCKLDTVARRGAQISSEDDWQRVDTLRADSDAILVGGRTLLDEDPRLLVKSAERRNARTARGLPKNPAKVGLVSLADLKPESRFLSTGPARRILYTTPRTSITQTRILEGAGAEVYFMGSQRVDLAAALRHLGELGFRKVMVEGGGTLIAELLRLGLADELHLYIAPLIFGGAAAPTLADAGGMSRDEAVRLKRLGLELFDDGGIVVRYKIIQNQLTEEP